MVDPPDSEAGKGEGDCEVDPGDFRRLGVILTTFDLDEYVFATLRAGASGFLLKDTPPADLLAAIRVVWPATCCWPPASPGGLSRSSPGTDKRRCARWPRWITSPNGNARS